MLDDKHLLSNLNWGDWVLAKVIPILTVFYNFIYLIVWFCEYFQKLSVRPNDDSSLTTLMTMQ